ncbi:signal peptidase I [Bacillus sp. AK128]
MQIDSHILQVLQKEINNTGWIELPAHGTSMFPLIREGDICKFSNVNIDVIKKGDIVLFQSSTGTLVSHRFLTKTVIDDETKYIFKGDTNLAPDEPIERKQIIGRLEIINKKWLKISQNNFINNLWKCVLLLIPQTSGVLRYYLNKANSST